MAGVVPKKSASGRKQWTLHEGPKSSLKRLRNQLANDGCPESQVVLAKQLLDEQCFADSESRENARLGVYWLIKASEQGNSEATGLLKNCLKTGKGISEHNYLDVKTCITMTQDEKLARKAAREMFASLSNGGDYITSEQLQRHMLSIYHNEKQSKVIEDGTSYDHGEPSNGELVNNYDEFSSDTEEEVDWSKRLDSNNEKLTEDHLVSAAVNYSHGQLPIVNNILCLTDPNLNSLDHIPYIHRSILHPVLVLKILYYKLIKFLGRQRFSKYFSVFKFDVQFLILMFIYSFANSNNMLLFIPMILYYVTFLAMVITTFQMLQSKRDFLDFRVWSGLFICYSGGSMNAEEAESQFIRNNLKPYGHFFVALLINLVVYPVIAEQWIPQSELAVVSFCLTFMTLLGFMPRKRNKVIFDVTVLFSFAINVLAKYPYETDPVVTQGWRFLELKAPNFASYVIGNGIEFCINFRIFFYVFIPVLFVCIASRENWRGTYKVLIPHCVTLSWLQIVVISSQGATMFGLIRSTLALVGVVLFLPLFGLTSIILPAAALAKWILTSSMIYSIIIFVLFMSLGLTICWFLAKYQYNKLVTFIQVLFISTAFYMAFKNSTLYDGENVQDHPEKMSLTWDLYQKFCVEPSFEADNTALMQIKCMDLVKAELNWNAYVNDIKIRSISNPWKNVFDMLPSIISQYFYCRYGEEIKSDCGTLPELLKNDCVTFYELVKSTHRCSMNKYNVYDFDVVVRMQSGIWGKSPEAVLLLDDSFKNFTLRLKPEDNVWFKGTLRGFENVNFNRVNGLKPLIKVNEIGCLTCHNSTLTSFRSETLSDNLSLNYVMKIAFVSFKYVLNLLFNPIVVFK